MSYFVESASAPLSYLLVSADSRKLKVRVVQTVCHLNCPIEWGLR